jgi:hypothetical protein
MEATNSPKAGKLSFMQEHIDESYKLISDLREINLQIRNVLERIEEKPIEKPEEMSDKGNDRPPFISEILLNQRTLLRSQINFSQENLKMLSKFI